MDLPQARQSAAGYIRSSAGHRLQRGSAMVCPAQCPWRAAYMADRYYSKSIGKPE